MVGFFGAVLAVEDEPYLAAHAAQAVAGQLNVELIQGDALDLAYGEADVIVASAGLEQYLLWRLLWEHSFQLRLSRKARPRVGEIEVEPSSAAEVECLLNSANRHQKKRNTSRPSPAHIMVPMTTPSRIPRALLMLSIYTAELL